MSTEDLWGNIAAEGDMKLPVTILKEQATVLGDKTNRILEGEVRSLKLISEDKVGYALNIRAPALDNFKYRVLHIIHSAIIVYPVNLYFDDSTGTRVKTNCDNEGVFIEGIKRVLSSDRVHTAISSLIAQSKAAT